MVRICGLKVEWTTSLEDHLRLDRRRKAIRVFSYKCCLQAILSDERLGFVTVDELVDREEMSCR